MELHPDLAWTNESCIEVFCLETCCVRMFLRLHCVSMCAVRRHVMGLHFIRSTFLGLHVTDLQADRYKFMITCSLRNSGPQFIILHVTDLLFIDLYVKLCVLYDRLSCLCILTVCML